MGLKPVVYNCRFTYNFNSNQVYGRNLGVLATKGWEKFHPGGKEFANLEIPSTRLTVISEFINFTNNIILSLIQFVN